VAGNCCWVCREVRVQIGPSWVPILESDPNRVSLTFASEYTNTTSLNFISINSSRDIDAATIAMYDFGELNINDHGGLVTCAWYGRTGSGTAYYIIRTASYRPSR